MDLRFTIPSMILTLACFVSPLLIAADGPAMTEIKQDGKLRLGMYLGFEGLSFKQRGRTMGLEVEMAKLVSMEMTKVVGRPIEAEIVNQEWGQIVPELNNNKYHAIFSALIPTPAYNTANLLYTQSYLDTGPVICTQRVNGKAAKEITEDVASLKDKVVVVINDPAVRRALRNAGVYVPADQGKTDAESSFPKDLTDKAVATSGAPLIPVKEIRQLDEMPAIYDLLATGKVDAGVIDLGIIWWVSTDSEKWSKQIIAFTKPVGPYIYCAATRAADGDLRDALNQSITVVRGTPAYADLIKKWHGGVDPAWNLTAADFVK